jgi:hypothetical protein
MKAAAIAGLLSLTMCSAAPALAASKVYRCGPDGREFSQIPCKEGRPVDTADERSATQQRDAQAVAASQTQLARRLEAERKAREAAAAGQGLAGIKPAPPVDAASAAKGKKKKRSKDGDEADTSTAAQLPPKPKPR